MVRARNILLVMALGAGLLAWNPLEGNAGGTPADKVSAAGSTEVVTEPGAETTVLSTRMRTSTPADLVLQLTAECSLITDVTTNGNDDQSATGTVQMRVTIDGQPVRVGPSDESDGRVTFCNRAYRRQTTAFGGSETIATYFATKSTHAFNWLAVNVGSGVHTIEVKALLTETPTNKATADAVIGNRTLIVEPTQSGGFR